MDNLFPELDLDKSKGLWAKLTSPSVRADKLLKLEGYLSPEYEATPEDLAKNLAMIEAMKANLVKCRGASPSQLKKLRAELEKDFDRICGEEK